MERCLVVTSRMMVLIVIVTLAPLTLADDISIDNWGSIAAPVLSSSEKGVYEGAELFAGPAKFDNNYFHGVLPNGRVVRPAGISRQIGMNPLGAVLTADGKYLITSNDDERESARRSLQDSKNKGGYSLSVVDTQTMKVVSQTDSGGSFFIGLAVCGAGPYSLWASGGGDNTVKRFTIDAGGTISAKPDASISITPITPANQGFVSNYTPDAAANSPDAQHNKPPAPSGFSRGKAQQIAFPAGCALSDGGRFLYVACNGDNSLAILDTSQQRVIKQIAVGYFPYTVVLSHDGQTAYVSNWGITEYKFKLPSYDPADRLLNPPVRIPGNEPDGFYVPHQSREGTNPRSSSISVVSVPGGDPSTASLVRSISQGKALDELKQVGDTHPSALALAGTGDTAALLVTRTNDDTIGVIPTGPGQQTQSEIRLSLFDPQRNGQDPEGDLANLVGCYPNALAVSSNGRRIYVAEAGINTVAVLEASNGAQTATFHLVGRIATGWYPTALALSRDDKTLYIVNAKGIGEDINPTAKPGPHNPTGIESFADSNFIFGTVQKVDLSAAITDLQAAASRNYSRRQQIDTSIVPAGSAASSKIRHVIFILHENKTFDSMLGNDSHFGPFASTTFNNSDGSVVTDPQYTIVDFNTRMLAHRFAAAVNYYSDSEESDAGHQFCASGTATDYTEKTLLVKTGRGLLVNKNMEPEDYPAAGYIFNNAARHGVSFKDYGALTRIVGTDTGSSTTPGSSGASGRTRINDPASGNTGYPAHNSADDAHNVGDVTSATQGLGQSYFMAMPALAVLGGSNPSGEPRLDRNYPGYNFNISDQRRASEFCKDFDRMLKADCVPQLLYIYLPNDHTGAVQARNVAPPTAAQQVADGDVALGMIVQHIMSSPIYYNEKTGEASAIFITFDDAQSTRDHIHPHRTPLIVVSPYVKPGYIARQHFSTASIVKTEELLLGLPPNNLGDLLATDLRDLFQPTFNGITSADLSFNRVCQYEPSPEGRRIWDLVRELDTSGPDRDSSRLGSLARLSMAADRLHDQAAGKRELSQSDYRQQQRLLYSTAVEVVHAPAPADPDD